MLSRVADSLYWMSRYMERSDGILRVLKTNHTYWQDNSKGVTWESVLKIFSYLSEDEIAKIKTDGREVIRFMVLERDNSNSVMNMVVKARENARSVQDHLTKEVWQCLNDYYHQMRNDQLALDLSDEDPITVLDSIIRQGLLYYGTVDVTMARGKGLSFMNIGKYVERGIQSVDILNVKFSELNYDLEETVDATYWKYLLLSIAGYHLYLKNYRSGFEARNVMDQVLFNETYPRSVIYSVNHLHRYFERLKPNLDPESYDKINFMIGKLRSTIQYSTVDTVLETGLKDFLKKVHDDLFQVGSSLGQHYLANG